MNIELARKELKEISPRIDFLHEVLGVGLFRSIIRTSDGFFLGMEHGDIGYNHFLGAPSENAIKRTNEFLGKMTEEARDTCLVLLNNLDIVTEGVIVENETQGQRNWWKETLEER